MTDADPAIHHLEVRNALAECMATIKTVAPLYPARHLKASIAQLRFILVLMDDGGISDDDADAWLFAARRTIANLPTTHPNIGSSNQ